MATWTLVIVFWGALGSLFNRVDDAWISTTTLPGFSSQQACEEAAANVKPLRPDLPEMFRVHTQCIEVK